LSEDELVATVILLLNAGHEATVQTIGNSVRIMLEQGIDARAAFASETATQATVEELLRLGPPLHLFARYALEEVEFDGVRLGRGEKIGLLLGAANRDPERFANPDAFQPDRPPNAHVSFGAGIHFCVGAPLARLELAIALPVLFTRLEGLRLIERPRYRDTFHFHGLEALRVEWA
jgi:cytochrome P450